jgi:trehalose 6-phosphate synthase/phosphatase
MSQLINVANRLPVTLDGREVRKSSGGLVSALEGVGGDGQSLKWVGWPGQAVDDPREQSDLERKLGEQFGYVPIFLSEAEIDGFYQGFANSSLWPLLHLMPGKFRYRREWWEQYLSINERFARAVLSIAKEADTVWVHDYHLMLLPAMLKRAMPSLKVGFFLHTPFPPAELFGCQPKRQELLEGLLGADQIGFHTFQYLRNFRSTVLRLLGIESDGTRIAREGHATHLGAYPIGINAEKFDRTLDSPEFKKEVDELSESHAGKRIVFSVERMDYTKGILERLDAIDLFLEPCEDRESIRFIFVSVPSREDVEEYKDLREEVEFRVGRLNGKYSTLHNTPVHFVHGSVEFNRLCAMYALAEVALVTPLVDGMNLVAKEFIACKRDRDGVLVLSEFAGAAEELINATLVNPYDARGVADALGDALRTSPQERTQRMAPMRERVKKCDAAWWARTFLADLASRRLTENERVTDPAELARAGEHIAGALRSGKPVAFFLDYDGTLREIERDPAAARPKAAVLELLDQLRRIQNLDVTIISGRRARDLGAWFGDSPFTLVAEHGADIRRGGQAEWDRLDPHITYSWKQSILPLLRLYQDTTPGSFVEEKRAGLVWHYRKVDPELGAWKAGQLAEELSTILASETVRIRHGKKIVEVSAAQVSKGATVARLLDEKRYELAMCAGDDQTDESMFTLDAPNLITIKVGRGDTVAQLRIKTPAAFRQFLGNLVEQDEGAR